MNKHDIGTDKLNQDELKKVLLAHDMHLLKRYGNDWMSFCKTGAGCIMQIALVTTAERAVMFAPKITSWFDCNYDINWTNEEFYNKLVEKGFVE